MIWMTWVMICLATRVMTIVLFFTPPFGFFRILGHWQLEQTPYFDDLNIQFNFNKTNYSEAIPWTRINRFNYAINCGPDYTVYTYYSVTQYFFGFWILMFLQTSANALAKIALAEDFKRDLIRSGLSKFFHCWENTNVPKVWMDWEAKNSSFEDYKKRHGQVATEMVVIIIIRNIFHAVMLVPLLFTGTYNKIFVFKLSIQSWHSFL